MSDEHYRVVYVDPKQLQPYYRNPRKNDHAIKSVADSIREFGFNVPILADENNVIIAGHTRWKAAMYLGLERVPVIYATWLDESKRRMYRLVDNKTAEIAQWDDDLLSQELRDIMDGEVSREVDRLFRDLFGDVEIAADEVLSTEALERSPERHAVQSGNTDGEQRYKYVQDIRGLIYEPSERCPELHELMDTQRADDYIQQIMADDTLDEDVRRFLLRAAERFVEFDYARIADYYAHAPENVRRWFERLILVVVDFDNLIENNVKNIYRTMFELYDDITTDE